MTRVERLFVEPIAQLYWRWGVMNGFCLCNLRLRRLVLACQWIEDRYIYPDVRRRSRATPPAESLVD